MQIDWEKIKSGKFSNGTWYDFGDIRLKLVEHKDCWILSLAVRVYTSEGKSMLRPFATVEHFEKPCTLEEAKELMGGYFDNLLIGMLECMTDDGLETFIHRWGSGEDN